MKKILPTRLRRTETLRRLVRETHLSMNDFIYPIFVVEGQGIEEEIPSMKGQYHYSIDRLVLALPRLVELGIQAFLLFGVPEVKAFSVSEHNATKGVVQEAIKVIKTYNKALLVITDVCLCQYKEDGHCCFFNPNGTIDRAKTLASLSTIALSHAQAGADMIAPSDMMDGRIAALRTTLDENGFEHIPIMSYSIKYASAFYGPFREAAHSAPSYGDRKSYQMDPANKKEAQLELQLDFEEGADILMVKPAMPYLDMIAFASESMSVPIAAYQVSGEYVMLRNAVDCGAMDEKAIYESLIAIKRSGAGLIISYFAKDMKALIKRYGD
jgi:porphobilinogen synthase